MTGKPTMAPPSPSPNDRVQLPTSEIRSFGADLLARLCEESGDRFLILDPLGEVVAASAEALSWRAQSTAGPPFGRSWLEWLPSDRMDEAAAALQFAARGGAPEPVAGGRSEQIVLRPLRDDGGDLRAILALWRRSSTALVEAVEARTAEPRKVGLEGARGVLPRADRQRALGEFVIAIVHDLNNVIASAASALRLIGRASKSGPLFAIAHEGVNVLDRGARLVGHIHDLARGSDEDAAPVSASKALDGLSGLIRALAGSGIVVEIDATEDVGLIRASSSRLDSVILTLTKNALDAVPAGGRVEISVRNADPWDRSHGLSAGACVRFDFVARGAAAVAQSSAEGGAVGGKGRGVGPEAGLASIFEFAARAGGKCIAARTDGGGSAVTLFLPRCDGHQPSKARVLDAPDGERDEAGAANFPDAATES